MEQGWENDHLPNSKLNSKKRAGSYDGDVKQRKWIGKVEKSLLCYLISSCLEEQVIFK